MRPLHQFKMCLHLNKSYYRIKNICIFNSEAETEPNDAVASGLQIHTEMGLK